MSSRHSEQVGSLEAKIEKLRALEDMDEIFRDVIQVFHFWTNGSAVAMRVLGGGEENVILRKMGIILEKGPFILLANPYPLVPW